jgi:hypothetical protein
MEWRSRLGRQLRGRVLNVIQRGAVAALGAVEGRSKMEDLQLTCGKCRKTGAFTRPVSVILIFAPTLDKPYPLIPAADYRVCAACDAVFTLVDRAAEAHPVTREAGPWSRAILVFADGHGVDVKPRRSRQPMATA